MKAFALTAGFVALLVSCSIASAAGAPAETATAPAATPSATSTAAAAPSKQEAEALGQGKTLESVADFQGAHDLYEKAAKLPVDDGGTEAGRALIQRRASAMAYLAPSTQISRGESIYWKPRDAAELERERTNLREHYDTYRKPLLALLEIIRGATKAAMASPANQDDKQAYQKKVLEALDAYVDLVAATTPQQRSTITFQQLLESIRYTANANKEWDKPERARLLKSAFMYADACRERVEMTNPFGDNFWER